jgi:hypothetical protein
MKIGHEHTLPIETDERRCESSRLHFQRLSEISSDESREGELDADFLISLYRP